VTDVNGHPVCLPQRPVQLLYHLISGIGPRAGLVLDPFSGGGSTGVAAAMAGMWSMSWDLDAECFSATLKHLKTFIPNTVRVGGIEQFARVHKGWAATFKQISL